MSLLTQTKFTHTAGELRACVGILGTGDTRAAVFSSSGVSFPGSPSLFQVPCSSSVGTGRLPFPAHSLIPGARANVRY